MREKVIEFEMFLNRLKILYSVNTIVDFEKKLSVKQWSKKEILGHLIDSVINNIQRLTEIHTFEKPYQIRPYNPDKLVLYNGYQLKNNRELYELWLHLNFHILHIIKQQSTESLEFKLVLPDGKIADLQFLIEDYFEHFYYHLKQINQKWT